MAIAYATRGIARYRTRCTARPPRRRIAHELVDLAGLGVDVADTGKGPQPGVPGGPRRLGIGGDGWLYFLAMPRLRLIVITRVIPPYEDF
ncbi:hypothetical protein [Streptomyces sp. NPDC094472]|uniref:hypothetical protein n=1 Tax=unclassified Streptomyces TaxID=2593676 RepID=UPI00331D9DDA